MQYTQCPHIDKDWSKITFGCWQIAPSIGWGEDACSVDAADAVVKEALDHGITAFDTAEGYGEGESERRLSKALGTKKDDVIIISKIWPDAELTLEGYQKRMDGTLRALGRDYVDLYLIHWPGTYFDSPDANARLCEYMAHFKEVGKAKAIGLSNFHLKNLKLLGDNLSLFDINQVPFNLLDRHYENETRDLCHQYNIQYMAYSPTAKGLLARRLSPEDFNCHARRKDRDNPYFAEPHYGQAMKVMEAVEAVANELRCLPIQVALSWVLEQDNILTAIVGSRKPKQVPEAAVASDIKLSEDQLKRLNAASEAYQRFLGAH